MERAHTDHGDEATSDPMTADVPEYRTAAELTAAVPHIEASPKGPGTLELIVRRPDVGRRELLDEAELSIDDGLVGVRGISVQARGPRIARHTPTCSST